MADGEGCVASGRTDGQASWLVGGCARWVGRAVAQSLRHGPSGRPARTHRLPVVCDEHAVPAVAVVAQHPITVASAAGGTEAPVGAAAGVWPAPAAAAGGGVGPAYCPCSARGGVRD